MLPREGKVWLGIICFIAGCYGILLIACALAGAVD